MESPSPSIATTTELAHILVERLADIPSHSRLLVGIAGIPASGKSTLAVLVVDKTNQLLDQFKCRSQSEPTSAPPRAWFKGSKAILVGLDGWHLTRAQLDTFPDPKLAHDRRGSHWTFDSHGYVSFVYRLREQLSSDTSTITAPSFDHALKDPSPHAITILPEHRIVVIEGLYTFLSLPPWDEAGKLLDERWLVEIDLTVASNRLVKRHVASGVAKDLEEARWRSAENDTPNGRFLLSNSLEPTRTIQSVDDPKYVQL
ncbi:P-loop containing nucleoside triphosphate hydrolase protein [Lactifluus subvellereus]|nr:P-loop containing nucleoside triphosphate hydrolase protein [Lactifluus subvellereus]